MKKILHNNSKKNIFFYCCLLCFINISQSQNNLDYGVAIKGTIDINSFIDNFRYSNYNISLVGGVGIHPFDLKEIYPTIHAGILLYNRGDLISSYNKSFLLPNLDFHLDFSLTAGVYKSSANSLNRFVPLYHFADFTTNPLENPYSDFSFTIGTNIIWLTGTYKKKEELPQRIGFTGIMIARRFQLSTYNDGSIWAKTKLGDGLDRFYTGGGLIAYHLNSNNDINNIELSFHKFTGHEKYAFDAANQLQLDFIPFKKEETYYYNKSRWRLAATSSKNNFGIHITLHNPDNDPQDWIHFTGQDTYHPDIFLNKASSSNEWRRMGIGGFWFNQKQKF